MKIGKLKGFLIALLAVLVLAIPFKVMVLVEGFTEVRPVNALPPVIGFVFGPLGAIACGIGNLIADVFGTFNITSLLGFVANMLAAYLPYRLWYIYSDEAPNFHKNVNIGKYIFICLSAALSVAWLLSFGVYFFVHQWIEQIYTYIFWNDFGFSIGLGMPIFIILTSKDVNIQCADRPSKYLFLKNRKTALLVPIVHTAIMLCMFIGVCVLHLNPGEQSWMYVLSTLGALGLCMILI